MFSAIVMVNVDILVSSLFFYLVLSVTKRNEVVKPEALENMNVKAVWTNSENEQNGNQK